MVGGKSGEIHALADSDINRACALFHRNVSLNDFLENLKVAYRVKE